MDASGDVSAWSQSMYGGGASLKRRVEDLYYQCNHLSDMLVLDLACSSLAEGRLYEALELYFVYQKRREPIRYQVLETSGSDLMSVVWSKLIEPLTKLLQKEGMNYDFEEEAESSGDESVDSVEFPESSGKRCKLAAEDGKGRL